MPDAVSSIPVTFSTARSPASDSPLHNAGPGADLPGVRPPQPSIQDNPELAARNYLSAHASRFGLLPSQIDRAVLDRIHDTGRGAIVARFVQQVGGVPVHGTRLSVVMTRDLDVVGTTGSLNPYALPELAADLRFELSAEDALSAAVAAMHPDVSGVVAIADTGRRQGDYRYLQIEWLSDASRQFAPAEPTRVRPVLESVPNGLVPAYYLELITSRRGSRTSEGRAYVISAANGDVLSDENLVDEVSTFRVWADAESLLPHDSPYGTAAIPHPTNEATWDDAAVFDQLVVTLPDDALFGVGDPWLPDGATESVGNNADSYADLSGEDGLDELDFRAETTGELAFEHIHDLESQPNLNDAQIMSEIVMQFYVVNYLHDLFYVHGFDEAAGNGQADNFERGGFGADPVRVEAQDATGYFNANMLTPADGASPRMQLFLYPKHEQTVLIDGVRYPTGVGIFSPPLAVSGVGRPAIDRDGNLDDGCSSIVEDLTGVIAILGEGDCDHSRPATNAQNRGAIGLLLLPTAEAEEEISSFGCDTSSLCRTTRQTNLDIPVTRVSFETAEILRAEAGFPDVEFDVVFEFPNLADSASVDNLTVAHEWGHYLYRRLAGAVRTIQSGGLNEGFADVVALLLTIEEADLELPGNGRLGGRYPIGHWIKDPPEAHFYGIRRAAYSTDFTINPFTFAHIANGAPRPEGVDLKFYTAGKNSQTHSTGEILAVTMLTVYRNLIEEHGFSEGRDRMLDYLVAGLTAAPLHQTFVEMRDAFLLVAYAADPDDGLLLWNAFAERGLGTGAVAPPRFSRTNTGTREDFTLDSLRLEVAASGLDVESDCDGDAHWDGREDGLISLSVTNTGPIELDDLTLTIATPSSSLEFPDGDSLVVGTLQPYETADLAFLGRLDDTLDDDEIEVEIELRRGDSEASVYSVDVDFRVNVDEFPASSSSDDVEVSSVWSSLYDPEFAAEAHWQIEADSPTAHHWFAANQQVQADLYLVSPPLQVDSDGGFALSFNHKHSFDWYYDGSRIAYLDGGVIEISDDDGETWAYVSSSGLYGHRISNVEQQFGMPSGYRNPLAGLYAFSGENRSWPDWDDVTIGFDDAYDGKTVRVRFRLATDMVPGRAYGWAVDDIEFTGITNTPFPSWTLDNGLCFGDPPLADAGPDLIVDEGDVVTISGAASADAQGLPLTYQWSQLSGPTAVLENETGVVVQMTAPDVAEDQQIELQLVVSADGQDSLPDVVVITVRRLNQAPVADAGVSFSVLEGDPVTLDGSGSSDGDGDEFTFAWRQTAGPEVVLVEDESASPSFTAPSIDVDTILTFSLTVDDGRKSSEASYVDVTVLRINQVPIADAGGSQVVGAGATSAVNGRDSFDPDGDELTFRWEQTSGTAAELGDSTLSRLVFTAPDVEVDEDLVFELVVSDGELDSPPANVTVQVIGRHVIEPPVNRRPRAEAGSDQHVRAGAIVEFNGSRSYDADGDELTYLWRQVAGTAVELDNTAARPFFEAQDVGSDETLTFTLVVSDGELDSNPDEVSVWVESNRGEPADVLALPPFELDQSFHEASIDLPVSDRSRPEVVDYDSQRRAVTTASLNVPEAVETETAEPAVDNHTNSGCNTVEAQHRNPLLPASIVLCLIAWRRRTAVPGTSG